MHVAVPVALVFGVAVLAGCGGGGGASSKELSAGDVAVVGGTQISKGEFQDLMATAKKSFQSQGRKFPKQGTQEYSTIKSQAMTLLIQQAERQEKAKDLGIEITDKQVEDRLAQIKKQYFGGSEKKYKDQLAKQGLSEDQVRRDIRAQLLSEKIFNKVTGDVKVTDADVHNYYVEHPQLYAQPQSRQVRHILVKKKDLADRIYEQLKGGADFGKLAQQYSQDPGSKAQGGKLTVSKGQTVPPFDKTAFALKTNELSKPVKTQYGWHIIQALSAIKPAATTPEKQVKDAIRQQLEQTKKNEAMTKWVNDTQQEFCKDNSLDYQIGFKPTPDPCAATQTTSGATSTAG